MSTTSVLTTVRFVQRTVGAQRASSEKSAKTRFRFTIFRGLLIATFSMSLALPSSLKAQNITAIVQGNTLVINGTQAYDRVMVYFNSRANGSLFVRVTNANSGGTVNGVRDGRNFELAGIRAIQVSLGGGIDRLEFLQADNRKKDWNGDLNLDFGTKPPGVRELLVIRGPTATNTHLRLRNIRVRGDHSQRNQTVSGNVIGNWTYL